MMRSTICVALAASLLSGASFAAGPPQAERSYPPMRHRYPLEAFVPPDPKACNAPDQVAATLDAKLQAWRSDKNVGSAVAALYGCGKVVKTFSYGDWNAGYAYPVASLSKAITAVCLAQLVDQGKLSYDDTLGTLLARYIPVLGQPGDKRLKDVTVGELLTHTGGLTRNAFGGAKTMHDAFNNIWATPNLLTADPPAAFSYSNAGYLLLGMVIETVSGQSYVNACEPTLQAMGADGHIDRNLQARAPNGGWDITAANYARFIQAVGYHSPLLGKTSRDWEFAQVKNADSIGRFYGLGTKVKNLGAGKGYEFWHDGEVSDAEGGGSYTLKMPNGYTVVVIFSGKNPSGDTYSALFDAMKSAITSQD
jgi:CubicO group peptidase (beta-lactamase class C family)